MAISKAAQLSAQPRVVVVGAGFAGLAAAQALAVEPVDITVIDRKNYHVFEPLLYQVATSCCRPDRSPAQFGACCAGTRTSMSCSAR